MRAISAADAVSLAVQRTRDFLFRPFNWGSYLKLGLVAIITEGLFSNPKSSSSSPGGQPSGQMPMTDFPPHFPMQWIVVAIFALALAAVVFLTIFYLVTRLRFAFFHCLVHNTRGIGPGWLFYREQAWRFFLLNVGVGFFYLLLMGLAALPFISGFVRLFHQIQQAGHPDIGLALSLVLPLIPLFLLFLLAGVLSDVVLRDWMLPHYALDNATAGEAWSRVWAAFSAEKTQFAVYAVLRLILPTLVMIGVFMLMLIPGLALGGSLAAVEFGLHSAFADASGASALAGVLLEVFFGVLAFGFAVLAGICIGGPLSTGVREYAIVFYGGRYPALGNILYPPIPGTAV
jgi:hypothetical protein